mgnify:CR=1 FL=1
MTVSERHDRAAPTAVTRNPGVPLDEGWFRDAQVNLSAAQRRSSTMATRRSVKKEYQAAWLLKAVTLIDLTTLAGDDTPGRVRRLAAKARNPVRPDILEALEMPEHLIRVAALCVYHEMIPAALQGLEGSGIPVAAVSTGFPAGLSPLQTRLDEVRASVAAGAQEIDIVISRRHVLLQDWQALYDEVRAFREACGPAHMKAILATGELATLRNVYKASMVAMMAGTDFIKTSTGKEPVNATVPVGLTMSRAIRDYRERTGHRVGLKPAGGIRTAKDALTWLIMIREELGTGWLTPELFRFGASGLLTDIERQLEHAVTGRYSADFRHPVG